MGAYTKKERNSEKTHKKRTACYTNSSCSEFAEEMLFGFLGTIRSFFCLNFTLGTIPRHQTME